MWFKRSTHFWLFETIFICSIENLRLKIIEFVGFRDGDADIYIAENSRVLPTYELEKYDLHAATCGDDVIEIPKRFVWFPCLPLNFIQWK